MAEFKSLNPTLSLPKASTVFNLLSGASSIFGGVLLLKGDLAKNHHVTDYFLILLIAILIGYIYYFHWRKQYIYSISGVYFHHVSHIMRDFLSQLNKAAANNEISSDIEPE